MHDVYHQPVPINLRSMFRLKTDVHNYRTRSASNQHHYVEYSRTEKMKNHLWELVLWYIWNGLSKSLKSLRNLNLNPKSNKFSWRFFTQNVQTDSQNVRTGRTRDWTKVDYSIYLNGTVTNAKVSATLVTVQISTNLYIIFSFHHLLTYWFCKPSYYYILYQLE